MKLNHKKLHTDILKKFNRLNLSQREGSEKIGVSRSTINRISKQHPIHLETYLRITDWLEKELEVYLIRYKRAGYIEKRIRENNLIDDNYDLYEWKRQSNNNDK